MTTEAELEYRRRSPRSRELAERARALMPGGTTRTTTYVEPYPIYIERGQGARVWDVDGVERLDLICNYSSMILGHAHPAIVAAIREQAAQGTGFAATNPLEVELAALLCDRVPSVERIRFCSSGTEATMFALRLARAFTRRPKTARCEGGYHGTHDFAEVSTHPEPELAGPASEPRPVADSSGTPAAAVAATVVLPFNDPDAAAAILTRHAAELAAVIVEPILGSGGVIAPEPGFLERLREVTSRHGILLIFDEIISLRVAYGGAQARYGVTPDLTTMGKIIGGGLPVAAFGGRADVMALLDPSRPASLPQGGTYNGNPLGMAAGLAGMRELTEPVFAELERKGERLRAGLQEAFDSQDLAAQVNCAGSLLNIHFSSRPVRDYRSLAAADKKLSREFFLAMMNEGVMFAPRLMAALPTCLSDAEIDQVIESTGRVAGRLAETA
ncbi:MAG: aspartate aminotransferase family protein [Candidatus Dormibacteraeota bacterium]|nr:aspartate aminotransferase family protein [Candidatus Dormibacteraeota bacterium]